MSAQPFEYAPSLDDFQALAEAAWAELPEAFRAMIAGPMLLRVEDFADEAVLREMRIENPFELTGLYTGVDLTQKSHLDGPEPDIVTLYRRPLLDEWCERGDITLSDLIKHVIVHEIGHHFGLSDEDMHRIEDSA